ncbi:hypothetical protein GF385_00490 [Candidatus Dependentiae bacterium]|nr:hypothetical protein [Candidatus Dependentiae bacterium]
MKKILFISIIFIISSLKLSAIDIKEGIKSIKTIKIVSETKKKIHLKITDDTTISEELETDKELILEGKRIKDENETGSIKHIKYIYPIIFFKGEGKITSEKFIRRIKINISEEKKIKAPLIWYF